MPMIVHVAYDENGKILAVVATQPTASPEEPRPTTSREGPRGPRFQERPGVSAGDFEVPEKFADKKMSEILSGLHVDVATGHLIEG